MKQISIALLVAGALLSGGCSPREQTPGGPATPTATIAPSPATASVPGTLNDAGKNKDVATAIIPAEKTEKLPAPTP